LCQQIVSISILNQKNKIDYAELNHVKYGLFSVNEWKRQVSDILTESINKLYLSKNNKKALKKQIEIHLNSLIDKVDNKFKSDNSGTAKGWVKQTLINTFISLDEVKNDVPEYADIIMNEMTQKKIKSEIKTVLNNKLKQYVSETFDIQDKLKLDQILIKTKSEDIVSAQAILNKRILENQAAIEVAATVLFVMSILIFSVFVIKKQPLTTLPLLLIVFTLIVLLITGIITPMIDMEAKISKMSFVIMDHPILFENQVLFFQSKSILDVFWIMVTNKSIQMKLVGVLLLTFSVFFPLIKIFSSMCYYYNYKNTKENPMIQFFVFKSGKWSIADVMVVAIFMAYIGFNGIITSQFGQLNSEGQDLVILTTNGTSLQPGYYLFMAYAFLSLFFSSLLARNNQ
jgi:hypothetical protein